MEFGQVKDLSLVDFSLPADHPDTKQVLSKTTNKRSEIYVGCGKWSRKDWINTLYPKGTKDKDFLDEYVKHFNSVELNATYHRVPSKEVIASWSERAGVNFRFCPKFPGNISHEKQLSELPLLVESFKKSIQVFGPSLGHCFLQFPPSFSPNKKTEIITYLKALQNFPALVFIEFRYPEWFEPSEITEEIYELMKSLGIGLVITDTAGRRDCVHQRLTIPHAFIRYVGNRLHPTDYTRINDWSVRISEWIKQGIESVCFFVHNDAEEAEVYSPALGAYASYQFNKTFDAKLPVPKLIDNQPKLL